MTIYNSPARANYDNVIFDLDGTLIDSRMGIHASVVHTLKTVGAAPVDQAVLSQFIGPPLIDSFQGVCGMSRAEAEHAVSVYKDYFAAEGIHGFEVYGDVPEMLWLLRASGVRMAIATTKDAVFARQIALTADLLPFFAAVIGSDDEGRMLRKPELIAAALSALGVAARPPTARAAAPGNQSELPAAPRAGMGDAADPRRAPDGRIVMVGDHALDVMGARANGIDSIAVTYGFGAADDLREAGPDHMADSVMELRRLLLGV